MKKVLMTASTLGHIRSFHLPYLQALAEKGYEVHLACPIPSDTDTVKGVHELIHVPFQKRMFSLANGKASLILRRAMKKHQYDKVISHTTLASFFTRLAVIGLRKKPYVVCMVHGYLFHPHGNKGKNLLLFLAEKGVSGVTDLVLTMNRWDYQQAKGYRLGKQIEPVHGIGVRPLESVVSEGLRESLSLPEGGFLLLFGGEFSHRKNQSFLIRGMKFFPEEIHLVLCGKGNTMAQCQVLAQEEGVGHRVHFLGHVSNLPQWYQEADVVVSGCETEGLAVHLMEALSLGKAVVVSDVKGHSDLVTEGETGLLYPFGEMEAYCRQVQRLYQDRTLGWSLGQRGKSNMERYQLSVVLDEVMKWYD